MKKSLIFIVLVKLSIITSCGTPHEIEEKKLEVVGVSETAWGKTEESPFFVVFETEKTIKIFQDAVLSSKKIKNVVDVVKPTFDIHFLTEERDEYIYHIWLGKEGNKSSLMKKGEQKTIYSVPAEYTDKLRELILQSK